MLTKVVGFFHFKERAYNKKVKEHEVWVKDTINQFRDLSKQYGVEGKKKAIEDYLSYLELTSTKINKLMNNQKYFKLPDEIGLDLTINCYGISTTDNNYSDLVELTHLNNYLTSKPHDSFKDVVRCNIFDTYTSPRQYYKGNLADDVSVLHSVYIYLDSVKEFLTKLSNLTYFENYIGSYKDVFLIGTYNLLLLEKLFTFIREYDLQEAIKNEL